MKNNTIITSLLLTAIISSGAFAVADNYSTTNTYSPSGGSLSNTLSADGNSASNNGMIGTSSSAFGNKLDSNISAVTRQDISNQQFGNSSVGNISNNSAGGQGGAGGYATSTSGGNTLSNGQGQEMGQGQSSENANNSNSGSSGNTTTVNGGNTLVQRSAPSLGGNVNFQQVGTSGFNAGVSTIMGGAQLGFNKTNKDAKAFMRAQTEETYQRANTVYTENVIRACSVLNEEQCLELKERLMNRLQ